MRNRVFCETWQVNRASVVCRLMAPAVAHDEWTTTEMEPALLDKYWRRFGLPFVRPLVSVGGFDQVDEGANLFV